MAAAKVPMCDPYSWSGFEHALVVEAKVPIPDDTTLKLPLGLYVLSHCSWPVSACHDVQNSTQRSLPIPSDFDGYNRHLVGGLSVVSIGWSSLSMSSPIHI